MQQPAKSIEILEEIILQNNLSDFETVKLTNSVVKKQLNLY